MCGIAGFIDQEVSMHDGNETIARMLKSIIHRGPDNSNSYSELPVFLGHNRLSIIDLSIDGNQPMIAYNNVIVYNGEIYNYIEVRNELISLGYSFFTKSDTEVILAAYDKWGKECVKKFVGMWAFALWNKEKKTLFCSRDRFGIKPFYYLQKGSKFYFGSEYKALKCAPIFSSEYNHDQISRGLQLGWICYGSETYYSTLKSLPAACNLIYTNGHVEVEKYWDIDLTKKYSGTTEEKYAKFKELFTESIKLHMRADVEVGGCLSGGIDSSAIVSMVGTLYPENKFKTFTIFYEGENEVDERPWVGHVLKKYNSLTGFTFSPTSNDIPEGFEKTLYHADVPITGSSPVSQYFVMQLAKSQKIKVLLDGQGADEYLAGYLHSFYRLIGGYFKKLQWGKLFNEFNAHSRKQNFTIVKRADLLAKSLLAGVQSENSLYQFEYKKYYPFLSVNDKINFKLQETQGSKLNDFLYQLLFNTSLPSLLHYEDRNSMAFSIESRVPFLDHRLVDYVFSIADSDKFELGETKKILRQSLKGILPQEILNRSDKKGFVTPGEIKWLRGPLNYLVNEFKYDSLDFLNISKTKKVVDEFIKGDDSNANLVWRLAVLNHWIKKN